MVIMGINAAIGIKINKLRSEKGMTLKNVSVETGLSIGFLSQLERGITTVAIDTLDRIALALEVDISHFFTKDDDGKANSQSYIVRDYQMPCIGSKNNMLEYSLSRHTQHFDMMSRLIELRPLPQNSEPEIYRPESHFAEEVVYVLEGILTIIIEDDKYELYPGDTAHFTADKKHTWFNTTTKSTKIVVINSPNPMKKD